MTAEQIITLLSSHFCLLSPTENIRTETKISQFRHGNSTIKKHNHNGTTSRIVVY